jgi:hypothetical protein
MTVSTRGWVFQERLVSPRTLHYINEGILWECAKGISQSYTGVDWKVQWKRVIDAPFEQDGEAGNTDQGLCNSGTNGLLHTLTANCLEMQIGSLPLPALPKLSTRHLT